MRFDQKAHAEYGACFVVLSLASSNLTYTYSV